MIRVVATATHVIDSQSAVPAASSVSIHQNPSIILFELYLSVRGRVSRAPTQSEYFNYFTVNGVGNAYRLVTRWLILSVIRILH